MAVMTHDHLTITRALTENLLHTGTYTAHTSTEPQCAREVLGKITTFTIKYQPRNNQVKSHSGNKTAKTGTNTSKQNPVKN